MFSPIVCPICGKEFIPAPLHIYKVRLSSTSSEVLVCTWTCMRKGEKIRDARRKRSDREI